MNLSKVHQHHRHHHHHHHHHHHRHQNAFRMVYVMEAHVGDDAEADVPTCVVRSRAEVSGVLVRRHNIHAACDLTI